MKLEIHTDLQASKDLVIADPLHLFNVFRNIVDNAIKFNTDEIKLKIKSYNEQNKICIEIMDNGIGMSRSTQSQIFDNFYRYTEGDLHNTKGFGLGLSYVKKVADHFGAEITVKSELGKGSTFKLSFNLANEEYSQDIACRG